MLQGEVDVGNLISKNSIIYSLSKNTEFETSQVNALYENGNPLWGESYKK
ncbi:hypothetical protein JBKA6_0730 [Ichthyobacterium seriolicida]|uniref:Uncharacterized protein n=1 Tax=Ichthyobacterium seriolicida TaxID=242600 RepID=A0A1J1DXY7_9FLAO|nr:hypothetical protein JBKA6_0730 [Ichthyobacterium seriolicida]